jgi:carboxypeptidase C (cathepsin A)
VARYAALTGLSEDYVGRVNLRVEHIRFFTELLRHRRLIVGRLDSRFTAPDADYGREMMSTDPAGDALFGAFTAAFNHYVRDELEYESDLPYEILSYEVNKNWSYKEFENAYVSTSDKLAEVLRTNPHLKVHVAFGYYDGATPYYAAEQILAQLEIPAERTANIERAYYPAGHMMYVHEESRQQQSADLAAFVRASSNR